MLLCVCVLCRHAMAVCVHEHVRVCTRKGVYAHVHVCVATGLHWLLCTHVGDCINDVHCRAQQIPLSAPTWRHGGHHNNHFSFSESEAQSFNQASCRWCNPADVWQLYTSGHQARCDDLKLPQGNQQMIDHSRKHSDPPTPLPFL